MPLLFNFAPYNPTGDIIAALAAQLSDLGHRHIRHWGFLPPPAVNLVLEAFDDNSIAELMRQKANGNILVCVATEMATCATKFGILWNYLIEEEYWRERSVKFVEALPQFDAVWCLVSGTAATLKRWHPKAFDIELGYSPRLMQKTAQEPAYDFAFFGSRSPRREGIIGEFRRAGYSVLTVWDRRAADQRDQILRQARVVLDIRHNEYSPVISTSRIGTALHVGRPVVVEMFGRRTPQRAWLKLIAAAEPDGFLARAMAVLADWQQEHAAQTARFRRLTAARCLGRAVKALPRICAAKPAAIDELLAALASKESKPAPEAPEPAPSRAPATERPRLVGTARKSNLVQWGNRVWVVPQAMGPIDLDKIDLSRLASVRVYSDVLAARQAAMAAA
jgi:hypothetical protein